MKQRILLPVDLVVGIEHRATEAGRTTEQEAQRLMALGLLDLLADWLSPLLLPLEAPVPGVDGEYGNGEPQPEAPSVPPPEAW